MGERKQFYGGGLLFVREYANSTFFIFKNPVIFCLTKDFPESCVFFSGFHQQIGIWA